MKVNKNTHKKLCVMKMIFLFMIMIFSDISLSEASHFNLGVNNNINNLGIFVPPHFVSSNIKPTKMNKFSRNKEYDHSHSNNNNNNNNNLMNEIFLQIELQKNLGYESSNQIEMLCKKLSHEKSNNNIDGMIWKQVYPFHSIDEDDDDGWMMTKSDDDFCKDGSNNCKHYNLHVMNLPSFDLGRTLIGCHRFDLCNFKSIPDYYHIRGKREFFFEEKGKKKTISLRDNTIIYSDGLHCVLENPWTIKVNEDLKDMRMKGFLSSEDMIQLKHCICRRVEI